MPNRSLWSWTLVIAAALAILGVGLAWVLEAVLPAPAVNLVAGVFFFVCVLVVGILFFVLRPR